MSTKLKVAVVGAGMGGMACALGLARRGMDVTLYEQAGEHRELGAGLWISMNGARVLEDLGLGGALRAIDLPPQDRVVRLWNTGESWSIYNRGAANSGEHRLYMVLRYELLRIMVEAFEQIRPGHIKLGCKCAGVDVLDDGVEVHFDGQPSIRADVVIGADGVHSRVRRALFGEVGQRFTDALAWRGLVPMSRLSQCHRKPVATTWIGPTAHITCYPVHHNNEEFVSFSGQVDSQRWEQESWSEPGALQELLNDFQGWHPEVVEMFSGADVLYKWGLFVRNELPSWVQGRAALLGDACHSMVPYLGQGVNMAFEDSGVLVKLLADHDDPVEALQRYDQLRRERGYQVARASMDMLKVFHHPSLADPATARPYIQETWSPARVRERYDWILEYNALEAGAGGHPVSTALHSD